jgi:hypothetical protein
MVAFFNYNMDDEWDIRENSAWPQTKQKEFMEKLGEKEGYDKPEEWIGYPKQALKDNGGYGLLKLYKGMERVVKTLISETRGMVWRRRLTGMFSTEEGFRRWVGKLLKDHDVQTPSDCYKLRAKDFRNRKRGPAILQKYGGFVSALQHYYGEEYRVRTYRFAANGCWDNPQSIIDWKEDFESENQDFSKPQDYYKIKKKQIPVGLRRRATKNSPSCVVKELLFSDYEFDDTLFSIVPDGTWKIAENRIKALRRMGEIEGFEIENDWYGLTQKTMNKHRLGGLLNHWYYANGKRIQDVPKELYPEYDFLPWLFDSGAPPDFWNDITNIIWYMKWLDGELKLDSWYNLRVDHLLENHGSGLISIKRYANRLSLLVVDAFPEQNFDPLKFRQRGQMGETGLSRLQEEVTRAVQSFFTEHQTLHEETENHDDRIILINHKHEEHRFSSNEGKAGRRSRMESDIWVRNGKPGVHVSIETHGNQHHKMPKHWVEEGLTQEEATKRLKKRDIEKEREFKKAGYIVIVIWEDEWKDHNRKPEYIHQILASELEKRG